MAIGKIDEDFELEYFEAKVEDLCFDPLLSDLQTISDLGWHLDVMGNIWYYKGRDPLKQGLFFVCPRDRNKAIFMQIMLRRFMDNLRYE